MINQVQMAKVEISSLSMVISAQFDLISADLMRIQHLVSLKLDSKELEAGEQADTLFMRSQEIVSLEALLAQRDTSNDLREISTRLQYMVPEHKLCEARNESNLLKAKVGEACEEQLILSSRILHLENECEILRKGTEVLCKQMEVSLIAKYSHLYLLVRIRCMNRVQPCNLYN